MASESVWRGFGRWLVWWIVDASESLGWISLGVDRLGGISRSGVACVLEFWFMVIYYGSWIWRWRMFMELGGGRTNRGLPRYSFCDVARY